MTSIYIRNLITYAEEHIDDLVIVDQDGKRKSTYRDWLVLSRKVASYLKANLKDINPEGEYLLLECPNGLEYEAAKLGAWMMSCAVVPLGVGFPEDRKQFIKAHCNSRFSFTPEIFNDICNYDPIDDYIIPDEKQPALLVYTSGSTGVPKGVMHRISSLKTVDYNSSYVTFLSGMKSMLLGFPSYIILGSLEFQAAYGVGVVNHFLDANRIADPQYISEYILKHNIDSAGLILPIIPYLKVGDKTLKRILTGGAQINNIDLSVSYRVYLLYGATEMGAHSFLMKIDRKYDRLPLGVPDNMLECQIFDDNGNPAKDGEEGELCLKTRADVCYFKDPKATEKLLEGGWHHTGDIVVKGDDRQIYFVGRKDSMIKINGSRVEPAEVERTMSRIDGVAICAVRGFKEENAEDNFLCGYYTSDIAVEADYVRSKLLEVLPTYMVPRYIIKLDTMPLTGNGKVDVQKLPKPDQHFTLTGNCDLLSIVCRLMCDDDIKDTDNLVERGLSSMMAIELSSEVEKILGKNITTKDIMLHPTVKELESLLQDIESHSAADSDSNLYPVTSEQLEMIEDSLQYPDETVWLLPIVIKLKKEIDCQRMVKALEAVADIHPVLKTRLAECGSEIRIRNCSDEKIAVEVIETEKEPNKEFFQNMVRPFRMFDEPLVRFSIVSHDKDLWLFANVHHCVIDGTSLPFVFRDLAKAYFGETIAEENFSFFDYCQQQVKTDEEKRESVVWFDSLLNGKKTLELPYSADPDTEEDDHNPVIVNTKIDDCANVTEICKNAGVTESTYFVYHMLCKLQESLKTDNGVLWVNTSGRLSANLDDSVGMFLNVIPVVLPDGYKELSLKETLRQLQEQMLTSLSMEIPKYKGLNFVYQGNMLYRYMVYVLRIGESLERLDNNTFLDSLIIEIEKGMDASYSLNIIYDSSLYSRSDIETYFSCASRL